MRCYAVVRKRGASQLLVVFQSDFLRDLPSRFVIPLLPKGGGAPAALRLHPTVEVDGRSFILGTHLAAGVPLERLEMTAFDLSEHHDRIRDALDFLFNGI